VNFWIETFWAFDLDWQKYVETDSRYYRPAEVDILLGDASKARAETGLGAEGWLQRTRTVDGGPRSGVSKTRELQPRKPRALVPATKAGWGTI